MASLTGEQLKDTYDSLLKVDDNGSLGGTYKEITDGLGNGSNLYLGTGGNVGIGTDNPSTSLEVAGDIKTTGDITIDNSSGDPFLKLKTTAQEYVLRIKQSDSEKFQIRDVTNSLDRLTIDSSGNVGIGTTSPSALLDVDGDAEINGITVGRGLAGDDTNTALGRSALNSNTTGNDNTAVGRGAMFSNTTGGNNIAVGRSALSSNDTGSQNTALGRDALTDNTNGSFNTAVGSGALDSNTTGASNTAVGRNAGDSITTGSNNLVLGVDADTASATSTNSVTLGDSSITTIRCQVQTISSLSDARDKKNIEPLPLGLDFINSLNPVKFTWDMRDGAKVDIDEAGFIAQELDQAQQDFNAEEYMQLVLKDNPDKLEASYGKLVPILVNAIKELKAEIEQLKAQ